MAEVEVTNRRGKDYWVDKSEAEAVDFAQRLPCPASAHQLELELSHLVQFS
jgi:hypothetical protein